MISVQTLTEAFGHIDGVAFDDETGLVRMRLSSPAVSAEIFLQGAHITKYQPDGGAELLFLSRESKFVPGKAIRGGIPIILPWFGPFAGDATAPAHGVARTSEWRPEWIVAKKNGSFNLLFDFSLDPDSNPWWPHQFKVAYEIEIGASLGLSLIIENSEESALDFEAALHTYFAVGDITRVQVLGLDGCTFLDQLSWEDRVQSGPITFEGEFDSIFRSRSETVISPQEIDPDFQTRGRPITIVDPSTNRSIRIETNNTPSTVVWNPWIAKSARTADLGDDEWTGFVCVESGFVHHDKLHLEPGAHGIFQVTYKMAAEGE